MVISSNGSARAHAVALMMADAISPNCKTNLTLSTLRRPTMILKVLPGITAVTLTPYCCSSKPHYLIKTQQQTLLHYMYRLLQPDKGEADEQILKTMPGTRRSQLLPK